MKLRIHQICTFGPVKRLFITDLNNVDSINLSWVSAEVFFFSYNVRSGWSQTHPLSIDLRAQIIAPLRIYLREVGFGSDRKREA